MTAYKVTVRLKKLQREYDILVENLVEEIKELKRRREYEKRI